MLGPRVICGADIMGGADFRKSSGQRPRNIHRGVVRAVVAHVHAQVDRVVAVLRYQVPRVILRDLEAIGMGDRRVIVGGRYYDVVRHREIARAGKQQPRRQRQLQRDVVIPIIQGLKGGIDR